MSPSMSPSMSPTISPTMSPTMLPTMSPTMSPTPSPTMSPTMSPLCSIGSNPVLDIDKTDNKDFHSVIGPCDPDECLYKVVGRYWHCDGFCAINNHTCVASYQLQSWDGGDTCGMIMKSTPDSCTWGVHGGGSHMFCQCTPPTGSPTMSPTMSPSMSPSMSPTISPTMSPTMSPTPSPTMSPTPSPTMSPTMSPLCSIG